MLKRYIFALIAAILCTGVLAAQDAQLIPIRVVECEHGSIFNLPESAMAGDYVDFSVQPDNGYELEEIICQYVKTPPGGEPYAVIVPLNVVHEMQYYFLMPECDRIEIYAHFKRANYTVTLSDDIVNGRVYLLQPTGDIQMGDAVRLKAVPDTDYLFGSVAVTTTDGDLVACTVSAADNDDKYIDFTMPNANVLVMVTFNPEPGYAIKVAQHDKGTMHPYPSATGRPGETIELHADSDPNYQVTNVRVVAGYEITGGGGGVHAPGLLQGEKSTLWFVQQEIPVEQISSTIYSFTLPEQFDNALSPNYQDNTEFRVTFDFEYVGPQVVYCQENTTLYFINPGKAMQEGDTWRGHTVTKVWGEAEVLDNGWEVPGWNEVNDEVTAVDFASEFAEARPKSCYGWFYLFRKATFNGLEYLNTSEVTNMNSMFTGCSALTTVDVNTFDVSNVENASSMFRGCDNLTTIYCNNTWNIDSSPWMFYGAMKLRGAADFDNSQTGGSMANPHTGYFTGLWSISIGECENGTVTCQQPMAYTRDAVTLVVTPDPEYELQALTVTAADDSQPSGNAPMRLRGSAVEVGRDDQGNYTFAMPPAPVVVNATFAKAIITQVNDLSIKQHRSSIRYNMMGQPVGNDYKGIVIEDGATKIVK